MIETTPTPNNKLKLHDDDAKKEHHQLVQLQFSNYLST